MNYNSVSENTAITENGLPWKFFLITFGFSWLIWAFGILIPDISQFNTILITLGVSIPPLIAFLLKYQIKGESLL